MGTLAIARCLRRAVARRGQVAVSSACSRMCGASCGISDVCRDAVIAGDARRERRVTRLVTNLAAAAGPGRPLLFHITYRFIHTALGEKEGLRK
jgi:hypothetical protein